MCVYVCVGVGRGGGGGTHVQVQVLSTPVTAELTAVSSLRYTRPARPCCVHSRRGSVSLRTLLDSGQWTVSSCALISSAVCPPRFKQNDVFIASFLTIRFPNFGCFLFLDAL